MHHYFKKTGGTLTSLCTPAGARTLDTLIKSQVLYQLSYGCIRFSFAGAKVHFLFDSHKLFVDFLQKKLNLSLFGHFMGPVYPFNPRKNGVLSQVNHLG